MQICIFIFKIFKQIHKHNQLINFHTAVQNLALKENISIKDDIMCMKINIPKFYYIVVVFHCKTPVL